MKTKHILSFLLQIILLTLLVIALILLTQTYILAIPQQSSVISETSIPPIGDPAYPPPFVFPTVESRQAPDPNEPYRSPTPPPTWTPIPTPTLMREPTPTRIPIKEAAKDAEGTIHYFVLSSVDHKLEFVSLSVDGDAKLMSETRIKPDGRDLIEAGEFYPSPDGSRVAMIGPWDAGSVLLVDQGIVKLFYKNPISKFFNWFPDNTRILYGEGLGLGDPLSKERIHLSRQALGSVQGAAASPDGKYVIYSYNKDIFSDSSIWLVEANGRNERWLMDDPSSFVSYFSWSPNGENVVFWGSSGFTIFDVESQKFTTLDLKYSRTQCYSIPPKWSPDSRFVAYVTSRKSSCSGWGNQQFNTSNIILVDIENGKGYPLLTDGSAGNIDPAWSPDGKKVAFVSDRSGSAEIWMVNRDGTGLTQITHHQEIIRFPFWRSP